MNVLGYFLTKIFHPNIATTGDICVNTLKRDWNPSLGLRHVLIVSNIFVFKHINGVENHKVRWLTYVVLQVVRCLLIEPFPESALNEQAGKMLLDNYEEYAKHARSVAKPVLSSFTYQLYWASLNLECCLKDNLNNALKNLKMLNYKHDVVLDICHEKLSRSWIIA